MTVAVQAEWVPDLQFLDRNTFNIGKVENPVPGVAEHWTTVQVQDHWLYCRKCELSSDISFKGHNGEMLSLERPGLSTEDTNWCQIVAIGISVGQKRNAKKYRIEKGVKMTRWQNMPINVGDLVLCPHEHEWGITRSPYCFHDFFIDQEVPFAYSDRSIDNG